MSTLFKKTLLFATFFTALAFFPIARVSATNVYVGVQVTATTPINNSGVADTGKLWCLPVGTTMGLQNGVPPGSGYLTPVGSTSNPVTTILPTCPGSTIWSGLLNLTNGTPYTIRIYTPARSFCSGIFGDYNYCFETWDVVGQNKNCNDICAHYGQTPMSSGTDCYAGYYTYNCATIEALKGSSCSTCTAGSYNYYSKTDNSCFYKANSYVNCAWSDPNYVRMCICNLNNSTGYSSFNFSFTPTGI